MLSIKSYPAVLKKKSTILAFLMEHICFVAIRFSSVYEQRLQKSIGKTILPFFFS